VNRAPKPYLGIHAVIPVFFNEPPDLTGWAEGKPGAGRVIAVKSVLYSDGSSKRFYKMKPETKITPITKAEANKLMKATKRRLAKRVKETR
jgi:hypothetical protein